jgi:branched-chain amino acid aminotransferase
MTFPKSDVVWMNGKLVPWDDAKIHVGSHVIHYGSSVFEGIRCYATPLGPAIFRLEAHSERLFGSAKIYRMQVPYSEAEMRQAIVDTVAANRQDACYIRPVVYRGYEQLGVNPLPCPVDVFIMTWDWGRYLGQDALDAGVDVCVSTWNRIAPNTMPSMAKSSANYANAQLVKMEAVVGGFAEGIALDVDGNVSEGSAQNVFLVKKDTLITPPLVSSVLPGITRDTALELGRKIGLTVREERVPREALYLADEVFFTGTAAEITPVRSIDKIAIGSGKRGPVTERLQKAFFDVIECRVPDEHGWLTFVREAGAATAGAARSTSAG